MPYPHEIRLIVPTAIRDPFLVFLGTAGLECIDTGALQEGLVPLPGPVTTTRTHWWTQFVSTTADAEVILGYLLGLTSVTVPENWDALPTVHRQTWIEGAAAAVFSELGVSISGTFWSGTLVIPFVEPAALGLQLYVYPDA